MLYLTYNTCNYNVLFSPLPELNSIDNSSTIVLKMDTAVNPIGINSISGTYNQVIDMAIDKTDNIILVGTYRNEATLSFGNLDGTNLGNEDDTFSYLAKISEDGIPLQSETYIDEFVFIINIAKDEDNNYVLSGIYYQ